MSDRRNKREKEQLFNMPEIAKLEKKSFSGADLHDAISVCDDAGELHGAYSGSWKPVFCKQACL